MESTGETVTKQINYGGFWIRLVAILIDTIIIMVVTSVLQLIIGTGGYSYFINQMIALGYYVFLESGPKQGTIGKMVMDLKVTGIDHGRITVPRALGRYFAKMIAMIPMFIGLAIDYDVVIYMTEPPEDLSGMMMFTAGVLLSGLLVIVFYGMAAFHSRKQAFHDRVAKTYVIREQ